MVVFEAFEWLFGDAAGFALVFILPIAVICLLGAAFKLMRGEPGWNVKSAYSCRKPYASLPRRTIPRRRSSPSSNRTATSTNEESSPKEENSETSVKHC